MGLSIAVSWQRLLRLLPGRRSAGWCALPCCDMKLVSLGDCPAVSPQVCNQCIFHAVPPHMVTQSTALELGGWWMLSRSEQGFRVRQQTPFWASAGPGVIKLVLHPPEWQSECVPSELGTIVGSGVLEHQFSQTPETAENFGSCRERERSPSAQDLRSCWGSPSGLHSQACVLSKLASGLEQPRLTRSSNHGWKHDKWMSGRLGVFEVSVVRDVCPAILFPSCSCDLCHWMQAPWTELPWANTALAALT